MPVSCARARTALALSVVTVLVVNPFPSVAGARTVDPRELEARRDFAEARYEEALHIFAELFSQVGDPIHLRNLARCYQKLKRPAEAIASFQDYLVKGNLAPGERDEIESYIAEMRVLQRAERAPVSVPASASGDRPMPVGGAGGSPGETPAPRLAAAPPPVAARPSPRLPPLPAPPADSDHHSVLRPTGLALGAAGVVLLGVGVGYGMAARSAQHEVEYQYDPGRDADGAHYERLQWIAYAAGGVTLATGLGLLLASLREPGSSERSESHAIVSPNGVGWESRF